MGALIKLEIGGGRMLTRRLAIATALGVLLLATLAMPVSAAQPVYRSGSGHLHPTWGVDLDTGVFNCSCAADEDVYFDIVSPTERYLRNAAFGELLRVAAKPSYATCNHYLGNHQYKAAKNVGSWFCVKTSHGRVARVQITKAPANGDLYLSYRVWCKINDGC